MKVEIKNCWEHMACGREPGGSNASELGICAAAIEERYDGVNGGKNGGRFCWFVAGTLCKRKIQGTFAAKLRTCIRCPFYLRVEMEEGRHLVLTDDDLKE